MRALPGIASNRLSICGSGGDVGAYGFAELGELDPKRPQAIER